MAPVPPGKLTFIYIHGFGGEKKRPRFCENMKGFLARTRAPAVVENYPWESVKVDVLSAGSSWLECEKAADKEAEPFAAKVIDKYERSRTPYVLVGFSVGSRVILGALKARAGQLNSLKGVYFLGSAMPNTTTLDKGVLPKGMKIINYHSPLRDKVHKTAFSFMSELSAGGEVGYDDKTVFDNYAVSCTHAHKGFGVHIDYSQLAVPIAYISLFKHGFEVPGDLSYNIPSKVGQGNVWWNKVMRVSGMYNGKRVPVTIEQNNVRAEYFRALAISRNGERERIARGTNLHALLRFLKVDDQSHILESE